MASGKPQRSESRRAAEVTSVIDQILDGALAVFADLGVRRATIDDVARRAGIGRVTIYRRIGGKPELTRAVLVREAQRLFAAVRAATEGTVTVEDRVSVSFACTVEMVRGNPVWQRLLVLESEAVLRQLTLDGQAILAAAVAATVDILDPDGRSDLAPEVRLARAEVLVRIAHSVLLTPLVGVPLSTHDELVAFAREHMVPIATAVAVTPGR